MADKGLYILFPIRVAPGSSAVNTIGASSNGLEFPEMSSWDDCIIHIDCSAITLSPSVTFTIQERDEASAQWVTLTPTPAIAAVVGVVHQRVVIGRSVNIPFAQRLRLAWTFSGTGTATITVAAHTISYSGY